LKNRNVNVEVVGEFFGRLLAGLAGTFYPLIGADDGVTKIFVVERGWFGPQLPYMEPKLFLGFPEFFPQATQLRRIDLKGLSSHDSLRSRYGADYGL